MYRRELEHEARLIAQGHQLFAAALAERWKRLVAWFGFRG